MSSVANLTIHNCVFSSGRTVCHKLIEAAARTLFSSKSCKPYMMSSFHYSIMDTASTVCISLFSVCFGLERHHLRYFISGSIAYTGSIAYPGSTNHPSVMNARQLLATIRTRQPSPQVSAHTPSQPLQLPGVRRVVHSVTYQAHHPCQLNIRGASQHDHRLSTQPCETSSKTGLLASWFK